VGWFEMVTMQEWRFHQLWQSKAFDAGHVIMAL
jgi:hypothetical protein